MTLRETSWFAGPPKCSGRDLPNQRRGDSFNWRAGRDRNRPQSSLVFQVASRLPAQMLSDSRNMCLPMLGGNVDDRRLAQRRAPTERAPRFRSDPALAVKRAQGFLLKPRMQLDLVDRGHDARFVDDSFEVIAIEIRDADRANPSIMLETDERLPAFDIAVDARARPMDQVQ